MSKEEMIPADGVIVDKLPKALFRVGLNNTEHEVLLSFPAKFGRIRRLLGDCVAIEMSPNDHPQGRITYRHR